MMTNTEKLERCYRALLASKLGGPATAFRRINKTNEITGYIVGIKKNPDETWHVLFRGERLEWIPINEIET